MLMYFRTRGGDEVYTGTAEEIAKQIIDYRDWKITFTKYEDEEGYLAEVIDEDGTELVDEFADSENAPEAIASLYTQLMEWLGNDNDNIYCEDGKAECFSMDYSELLEKFTAREAWENIDDLSDEEAVREWYFDEKVAA